MGKALGIVYRTIATHLTHKAGYKNSTAHTGAVTLIQRFGSALNLNIHFDVQGRTNIAPHGRAGATTCCFSIRCWFFIRKSIVFASTHGANSNDNVRRA